VVFAVGAWLPGGFGHGVADFKCHAYTFCGLRQCSLRLFIVNRPQRRTFNGFSLGQDLL
jgi:hypothetical protein